MNWLNYLSYLPSFYSLFLTTSIYNGYYNPYNQVPPLNQSYYNSANVSAYPNRTDDEKAITALVEAALKEDPYLGNYASKIQVYTTGHEVTLSGVVDSDRVRLNAEYKAKNQIGVKRVINQISVEKTK